MCLILTYKLLISRLLILIYEKHIFFSLSKIVVGLMVFAIICTYTLQFYVPVAILWPSVQEKYGPFQSPALAEYLLRAALVFATCKLSFYNRLLVCYDFTTISCMHFLFGYSFSGRSDTSFSTVHIVGWSHRQYILGSNIPTHMPYGCMEGRRIWSFQLETPYGHHYHTLRPVRIRNWYIL